jgi:hypothetical protein
MATPSIRGHQGIIKVFVDGGDASIVNITRAEINQDSTFSRAFYVGQNLAEGDQTVEGWSGSMDLEVKGPEVDDLIDALVTNNLNGIGVSDYTVIMSENYADGTSRSYVYFDMQFKMSKTQPAMTEKVTKRLEFQASGRLAL